MSDTVYKVVNDSEVHSPSASYGRWHGLREELAKLPEGKWIEVPVPPETLPSTLATSIQQSLRNSRIGYRIQTRSHRSPRRLFIRQQPIENGGSK